MILEFLGEEEKGTTSKLTVEVLPVQLLNKLQHHPVPCAFPQRVPRRETFCPSNLPAFVLSVNGKLQLFNSFDYDGIVDRGAVQVCYDARGFFTLPDTKKMTAG